MDGERGLICNRYDARIRVALRRMARKVSIPYVAFLKLEEVYYLLL